MRLRKFNIASIKFIMRPCRLALAQVALGAMTTTRWYRYVADLIAPDNAQTAAAKAGFNASAFSRWKRGASAEPEVVVKLARAYGANVLEALVESELITALESKTYEVPIGRREAIESATDAELLEILSRRAAARHENSADELAARRDQRGTDCEPAEDEPDFDEGEWDASTSKLRAVASRDDGLPDAQEGDEGPDDPFHTA